MRHRGECACTPTCFAYRWRCVWATGALSVGLMLVPPAAFAQDTDGDGLTDADETSVHGTNPALWDTDGDGVNDGDEVNVSGTDPLDTDSDDDGLLDGQERVGIGGFNPPEEISTTGVDHLVDLDGDGDPDLLFTSDYLTRVANRLDESPPGFGAQIVERDCCSRTVEPAEAALIDMDDDGDLDVLRTEGYGTPPPPYAGAPRDNEVVLYENRIDEPTDDFADAIFPGLPIDSGWLRAIDFDGDGRKDLLRSGWQNAGIYSPTIDVLIDHGITGPPDFSTVVTVATLPNPWRTEAEVAAGDVDGDGRPDVVWVDDSVAPTRLSWSRHRGVTGAGDFAPPSVLLDSIELGAGTRDGNEIHVVDMDDTPLPEIVVWAYEEVPPYELRVDIHPNPLETRPPSAAPLPQTVYFPYFAQPTTNRLALVDVDGDGDRDLVGLHCSSDPFSICDPWTNPNSIAWLENRLNESPRSFGPRHPGPPGNTIWFAQLIEHLSADMDLDGDEDVLIQTDSIPPLYFENTWNLGTDPLSPDSDGDGLLDGDEHFTYGTNPARRDSDFDGVDDRTEIEVFASDPLLADTDGDGLLDGLETVAGGAPLAPPQKVLVPTDFDLWGDIALTDLDDDGDPDVVARSLVETNLIENRLDETSDSFDRFEGALGFPISSESADLAGGEPGPPDALVNAIGGVIQWHPYAGDPVSGFGSPILVASGEPDSNFVFVRDFDGDGDEDVLFVGTGSTPVHWSENRLDEPSADFAPPVQIADLSDSVHSAWVADLDGDGDDDLLLGLRSASDPYPQEVRWLENRLDEPSGDLGPPQLIAAELTYEAPIVSAGDVDGDGDLDPIAADFPPGTTVWFENRLAESGGFLQRPVGPQTGQATGVAAGDVNGDGRDDIAVAIFNTPTPVDLIVFETTTNPDVFSATSFDDMDSATTGGEVAIADLDLDGDRDVLFNDYGALHVIRSLENLGTDVLDPDSDDDGFEDGIEVKLGSDPNDPASVPALVPVTSPLAPITIALALAWTGARSARRPRPPRP